MTTPATSSGGLTTRNAAHVGLLTVGTAAMVAANRELFTVASGLIREFLPRVDRGRDCSHGMITVMALWGHDPIAKFIRWLRE